jgi:acyl carrier protein
MDITKADVEETIKAFLERANKATDDLSPDRGLFADGIGLDSLEAAELSAALEDAHGTDPFTGGEMPQTVGDILSFYGVAAVSG